MTAKENFEVTVKQLVNDRGLSRADAFNLAVKLRPELYRSYQQEAAIANEARLTNMPSSGTFSGAVEAIGNSLTSPESGGRVVKMIGPVVPISPRYQP